LTSPLHLSRALARHVRRRPDAAIAATVFAAAMAVGVLYCRAFERSKAPPEPWVKELGAAIAFACGRGYGDPGYAPSPAVMAFLEKQIDRVSCTNLPENAAIGPPNFTQRLYRYMTLSAGLTWRLFGASWASLALLFGVLHGASAAAAYGLFRLATRRMPALALTLIVTLSPIQLRYLPQLREYAKAPFILALMLILGLLVMRPFSRRRMFALAIGYGAVMGIGLGFRNDLLIQVLPFVATVALFLPVPLRAHLKAKCTALVLSAVTFVVCAWPIINAYRSGSNTGHVALLGLMTHFDAPLGVTASVYDWGSPYDDGFVIKVIGSYAERVHHRPVAELSSAYERSAIEYLLLIAWHWPADLLIRAYASVLRIVELPFQIRAYTTAAPPILAGGSLGWLYAAWDGVLSRLSGIGMPLTAVAIVAVASADIRVAAWLLASLMFFAGYPAVQFDARHFFFLEVIPWLALAVVAEAACRVLVTARNVRAAAVGASELLPPVRRAVTFAVVSILVMVGAVAGLRSYQQRRVAALIERYLEAPTDTLTLSRRQVGDRRVLLAADELNDATRAGVAVHYLVVEVARPNCVRLLAPVTFRYVAMNGYTDLSQRIYVPVPDADAPFRLFFPVYSSPGARFAGLELNEADGGCIVSVRRVRDLDRMPVLLNLTLPPDWQQAKLYQTLTKWERPSAPYRVRVYVWPRTLDPARLPLIREPVPRLASLSHSSVLRFDDAESRWVARGFIRDSTSFLVRLPERSVSKGVCFFARGTLYGGGFTLGILKDQLWATSVNVTTPGEFLAIVETPEAGAYVPALANFLTGVNRRNHFVVTSAGWADPTERQARRGRSHEDGQ
jgi:hypothetical protein